MVRQGGFDVIFPSGICAGVTWLDMEVFMLSFPWVFVQV